jgi:hypothetical protein
MSAGSACGGGPAEDLWQREMTSRVVLAVVPPGWDRTGVLDRLAQAAGR